MSDLPDGFGYVAPTYFQAHPSQYVYRYHGSLSVNAGSYFLSRFEGFSGHLVNYGLISIFTNAVGPQKYEFGYFDGSYNVILTGWVEVSTIFPTSHSNGLLLDGQTLYYLKMYNSNDVARTFYHTVTAAYEVT
jgi:hypothetical protein